MVVPLMASDLERDDQDLQTYSSRVPDNSYLHSPEQAVGAAPQGSFQSSGLNTALSINLWISSLTQQTT